MLSVVAWFARFGRSFCVAFKMEIAEDDGNDESGPFGDWRDLVGRRSDRVFVGALMRELNAGVPLDTAKVTALRESRTCTSQRGGVWSDTAVARVADAKLAKHVVREAMAGYLEANTGMSPGEMLQIRVQIARGEGIDPRTTGLQLRALEGLEKLTFVPAAHRVEIDSRSHLSAVMMSDLSGAVPSMDPRPVTPIETAMPGAERLEPVTLEADEEEPEIE